MTANPPRLRLGIALEGAGWHPSAWREPSSRPRELFTPEYWVDLVRRAEDGGVDFVTIEDSFAVQSSDPFAPDDRIDEVRGRLDAVLIASRVAPVTSRIGLIPTATVTHTEPFHVATGIATLDYTSLGRAGWQPKVSARSDEARHFGRREIAGFTGPGDPRLQAHVDAIFAEAADVVEAVRRLWDSWEDDAEIRDVATDRFLDADKVHRIDFEGEWFSVRGPAITPRPPQGQPVVAALAHAEVPYLFAARSADLVFVTPIDAEDVPRVLAEVRAAEETVGREGEPLHVYADLVVFLDGEGETASARVARLDALGRPVASDTRIFAGSAEQLADAVGELVAAGYAGVRLRPGVATDDLPRIAGEVVPELVRRGLLPAGVADDVPGDAAASDAEPAESLRGRLGLPATVPNRYAAVAV
ncbi:LLM class flavin-dependent oxidoreductase [Microbacterium sp. 18062]|uniref:LLM class flavin-dependent oxidoreductase n=1 Tax=Microbacterium sp. 18062 TaxID=2681410 RepID=UPI001358ECA8|nr:LLM class flavin-dependent oxidoreductase [Microbacterium sp. 18062]